MKKIKKLKKKKLGKTTLRCCYGVSSKCADGQHVFMIDYDGVSIENVTRHLSFVQQDMYMGDMYIIESSHGYNAVCLDKLPLSVIYGLGINAFSPADHDFFRYGFNRGYYVLRFDRDKKLIRILKSPCQNREKSYAHKCFLEWFFDRTIECFPLDDSDRFTIIQYPSNKNGYHEVDKKLSSFMQEVLKS